MNITANMIAVDTKTQRTVAVLEVRGGWSTVMANDGSISYKVRNSQLAKNRPDVLPIAVDAVTAFEQTRVARAEIVKKESQPVSETTIDDDFKAAQEERHPKDPAARKNGVVDSLYLRQYGSYVVERNGEKVASLDNGDMVAVSLRDKVLEDVYKLAADLCKTTVAELKSRYGTLNPGMQRMNLGNRIRAALRKVQG